MRRQSTSTPYLCLLLLLTAAAQGADSASRATSSVTHAIVFFPAASDPLGRLGFARIVNRSNSSGTVSIVAFDDSGRRYGPAALMLAPRQTAHFNSNDLEDGAPEKGLSEGVGRPTEGDWRLEVTSELDINVLSYIRTGDGFVTSMHDLAPSAGTVEMFGQSFTPNTQRVAFFNPGSNHAQQSLLRLVNPGAAAAAVTIRGIDDRGGTPGSAVRLSIPPGAARTLSAADLEGGMVDADGALGDGVGKWRLDVESDRPVLVVSLLATPTGHLTNLSSDPVTGSDGATGATHAIVFFPAASDPLGRLGFARIVNRSNSSGTVSIVAFDDSGRRYGPAALMLAPRQTAHFNSNDLEDGAPEKGLSEGVGRPTEGDWRLEVTSELDINVLSYIRTGDGFVTSMHDVAPSTGNTQHVAFFNPRSNHAQQSLLRLVNPGAAAAAVTIRGIDDRGGAPGSAVRLSIPPGAARTLSAADLEGGMVDADGALGDGVGKWRLDVESDRPVLVVSLLATPTGHLTNLSDPLHDSDVTWVFAGDVSDDHKASFRQEMKDVRSFFGRALGVQATSFTVLVGENYDALDAAYEDAVGEPLPDRSRIRRTMEGSGGALVATTSTRGAVLILLYGSAATHADRVARARGFIAHEYFHVLQMQLANGFTGRSDHIAAHYPSEKRVFWLVEGGAEFADFSYTPSSAARRPYFDRKSPYRDLWWGSVVSDGFFEKYRLSNLEGPSEPAGTSSIYNYSLGFAAVTYLVEIAGSDSYARYWRLLHDRETWRNAFEDAFGMGVAEFYLAFDEWLPLQLPDDFMVRLFIRWPDMDDLPQTVGKIRVRNTLPSSGYGYESARPGNRDSVFQPLRYSGDLRDSASSLIDTYGLWWWDGEGCTEHLLGWYENGELADQRDQATPIDLLDFDQRLDLDWTLDAHPSTLDRLESRTRNAFGC